MELAIQSLAAAVALCQSSYTLSQPGFLICKKKEDWQFFYIFVHTFIRSLLNANRTYCCTRLFLGPQMGPENQFSEAPEAPLERGLRPF